MDQRNLRKRQKVLGHISNFNFQLFKRDNFSADGPQRFYITFAATA